MPLSPRREPGSHVRRDQIGRLTYLILVLQDTEITGDGLSALSRMRNIDCIELTGTQLEDSDVAHITSLSYATQVRVGRTGLSASAVAELSQIPNLAVLGIDSSQAICWAARDSQKKSPVQHCSWCPTMHLL